MKRRSFLKGSIATSTLTVAASAGLLHPASVFADYPMAAFDQEDAMAAVSGMFGSSDAADSGDIQLKAPVQAENGAVVPVKVSTSVPAETIIIVVEGNPRPLVMAAALGAGANGVLSGRVKMGKTSNVMAYAKTAGGVIKTSQEVKVTVGGCGG
jgi:sulfur-oxidizing protein SoxY